MDYADKKRMPIDARKVKDLLRNRPAFTAKIREEIQNYEQEKENPQFQHGVLSYLNEAAWGEMRDLLNDIGVKNESIPFNNVGDYQKMRDSSYIHQSDHQFQFLMNALFTPLDMTDYEDNFVGFDEIGGPIPIGDLSPFRLLQEEPWPQNSQLPSIEEIENRPKWARSRIHKEFQDAKAAEAEAEAEGDEEEEEEGDEEEGDEEEGGEEAEEEEEEEQLMPEEEEWPPKESIPHLGSEDRYFQHNENLRNKFSEVELDTFMRLLNVKPGPQWEDQSSYHNKLGLHAYEDDSQHLDPAFHILGEVERQYADRSAVEEFRRGSEVKFALNEKRPAHYNYRF